MTFARGSGDARGGGHRGFTLLELLVVMALIAAVAGLSASAFQNVRRNFALSSAASTIEGILRAARNTSVATGTPSFVVIEPAERRVWAQSVETAGEWGFESEPARGTDATPAEKVVGAEVVPGRVGKALDFRAAGAHVDCGNAPAYSVKIGLSVDAWVWHEMSAADASMHRAQRSTRRLTDRKSVGEDDGPAFAVVSKPGAYFLGVTAQGALEGAVGSFRRRTESGVVPPGRWVHVSLRLDGETLRLAADGVERALGGEAEASAGSRGTESQGAGSRGRKASGASAGRLLRGPRSGAAAPAGAGTAAETAPVLPREVPVTPFPLTISSPEASFPGRIDEVRIGGRREPLGYQYAESQHIIGWKKVIHFDRWGRLDPAYHDAPVRVVLVELSAENETRLAKTKVVESVDYTLTFDEWLGRWQDGPPSTTQALEEARIEETSYSGAKKISIEVDALGVLR